MASSNGPLVITVNEKTVYQSSAVPDRAGTPAPEVARCDLMRGRNRILVLSRQGAGPWFYSIQVAPVAAAQMKPAVASTRKE